MCVVKEVVRDPAARSSCSTASASSAIVTPGTTSGATAAIACSTVRIARPIASSSSDVFTRRRLVHERRAGAQAVEPEDPAEIQDRLAPDPVADGDRAGRAEAVRHSLERRKAVVGLVDDHELALRLFLEVEGREHAREDEDRSVGPG